MLLRRCKLSSLQPALREGEGREERDDGRDNVGFKRCTLYIYIFTTDPHFFFRASVATLRYRHMHRSQAPSISCTLQYHQTMCTCKATNQQTTAFFRVASRCLSNCYDTPHPESTLLNMLCVSWKVAGGALSSYQQSTPSTNVGSWVWCIVLPLPFVAAYEHHHLNP